MLGGPRVLLYHGFGTRDRAADPFNLFVPPDTFEEQLRLLLRRHRPLDLDAYLSGLDRGSWRDRSFLVTIDDGYVSAVDVAGPILARLGVPSVLFVPPAHVGGTSRWMREMPSEPIVSMSDLSRSRSFGMDLGVHGLDHTRLTDLPPDVVQSHVASARARLAMVSGLAPEALLAFAYPDGAVDEHAAAAVQASGFAVAFSVHQGGGRFAVPRRPVTGVDTRARFRLKLAPAYQPLRRVWAARRRVLRRS